jgi:spermidine synthase
LGLLRWIEVSVELEYQKRLTWILRTYVFIGGAAVMALELLGSRFLAPHFGSTIFVWGSLIGVVMAALALGYYCGGRLADMNSSYSTLAFIIFAAGVYMTFIAVFSPDAFEFTLMMNLGDRYGPLLASVLLLALPTLLLGMVSPYAIKLAARTLKGLGSLAGSLYALSTVGSIVGTFVTVFVLIPEFGVLRILYALSILLMGFSIITLSHRMKAVSVLAILLAVALATSPPAQASGVIYMKDTPYHHLVVMDNSLTDVRTLLLDNNFHGAMDLKDPDRIVYKYMGYFHLAFLINPEIKDVLFVGGGSYFGPKKFLKDYSWITVDVVEIDPEVTLVAKEYFGLIEDPRLNIYSQDGRIFLTQSGKTYDLIVMDAYARTYIPFHMMTHEFMVELREHLNSNGIVVFNVLTSLSGEASLLFKAEYRTIKSVFPQVYVFPVSSYSTETAQNIEVVATKSDTFYSKEELISRAENYAHLGPPQLIDYASHYWETEIETAGAPIVTDDYAPLDNMLNPLTRQPYVREEAGGSVLVQNVEDFQLERLTLRLDPQFLSLIGIGLFLSLLILLAGRGKSSLEREGA